MVKGQGWRRTGKNLYVPTSADRSQAEQRITEEAARLPSDGAVTGWASLLLHGGNFFDGRGPGGTEELPIQLALPMNRNMRPRPGVVLLRSPLPDQEIEVIHGVPVTSTDRALFDLMARQRNFRAAAIQASVACSSGLTTLDGFRRYVAGRRCIAGIEKVRRALVVSADRVRSPKEAELMLIWHLEAELPMPLMNWPVFDELGTYLGSPDLLCPVCGVYGEYDGRGHEDESVRTIDADRDSQFASVGLIGFRATSSDLQPATRLVDRMLRTVRQAEQSRLPRTWQLGRDPWPLVRPDRAY